MHPTVPLSCTVVRYFKGGIMQTVASSLPFDNENRKEKQNTQFLSACQAAMCQEAEEKKDGFPQLLDTSYSINLSVGFNK